MRWAAPIVACVMAFVAVSRAHADDPQVLTARLENAEEPTVGDRMTYRVEIAHDLGTSLIFPAGAQIGDVDIVGGGRPTTVADDGRLVTSVGYEVAAFRTGPLLVGPLPVSLLDASGTPTAQFEVAPIELNVLSFLGSEGAVDLRDIRAQFEPAPPTATSLRPLFYGLAAVAVALALAVVAFLARRRLVRHRVTPAATQTPEERAADDLQALAGSGLLQGDPRENYATLSRAVRTYLAGSYEFPALASSTAEIEREMLRRGLDRWQARLVSGLLGECDDVVYAGYVPAPGRAESDLNLAFQVVEMAERPTVAPAPAPAGGG